VVLQGRLKVTQAEGLREAVICDMGLTVASEWLFSSELRSGKVVAVLEDWRCRDQSICRVSDGPPCQHKGAAFVSFVERFMTRPDPVSPRQERAFIESVQDGAGRHTQRVQSGRVG